MSQTDPETMASLGGGKFENLSPDMVKTASNMISKMPPEEFEKMLEMASSFQGGNGNPLLNRNSNNGNESGMPNLTPDMIKSASDMMSKMPPEELQKMFEMASSLNGGSQSNRNSNSNNNNYNNNSEGQERPRSSTDYVVNGESGPSSGFLNSRSAPQPSFPSSSSDIRNQLKNPAMREVHFDIIFISVYFQVRVRFMLSTFVCLLCLFSRLKISQLI